MKIKFTLLTLTLSFCLGIFAQSPPEAINYQAVARNLSGVPLVNQSITVGYSILQGSSSGTVVYSETHAETTNQFGLFTSEVGMGTVNSGNFSTISWGSSTFYLQVTVDGDVMPATQLLSVPYALHAKTASSGIDGHNSLISSTPEPAGVNCANGGYYIQSWLDLNDDGALSTGETPISYYICNGEDGANGLNGNDGVGIASTVDNGDGTFTITYTDTTTFTTSDLTGPMGPAGTNGTTYFGGNGISLSGDTITNTGDADNDSSNELITLTNLNGNTIEITENGTLHSIDLTSVLGASYTQGAGISIAGNTISATDTSITNELQTLLLNGAQDSLFISNGNGIQLPTPTGDNWGNDTVNVSGTNIMGNGTSSNPLMVIDNDTSATNEYQDLSVNATNGNEINISNGTGFFLSQVPPTATNQVLTWDGANWVAQNPGTGADNWGTQKVEVDSLTIFGDGTTANPLSGFDGDYNSLSNQPTIPTNTSELTNDSGFITNPDDADFDPNNEIQTLSFTNPDLTISGGNTVDLSALSGATYTAGSDIDITSNVITNTAPDQVVSLQQAGATTVTGTYPNFTISSTDNVNDADADITNELQTISASGGTSPQIDLSIGGGNVKILGTGGTTVNQAGNAITINSTTGTTYTAGTGIDITGNTISNTSLNTDDQQLTYNSGSQTLSLSTTTTPSVVTLDVNDADADTTNEIQVLSFANPNLTLSNGGGMVDLSSLSSNSWGLSGNGGTTSGTNFIGTTDAQDLDFRTNNQERLRITQKGQLEILNTGTSVFIGEGAGDNDDLNNRQNTFVGHQAGEANTTGNWNTALGYGALVDNVTGTSNTALGRVALAYSTGSSNTATGTYALFWGTTGSGNTATGTYAGQTITTGSNNTFLGYQSDATNTNLTNATAIGYNAKVSLSNSLILGNNANVGIGISSPLAKLHLDGTLRLDNLGGTAPSGGEVLTYNSGTGTAQWQTAAGDADWTINGFDMYNSFTGNIGVGVGTSTAMLGKFTIKDGNTSTNGMDGVFLDIINTSTNTANTIAGIRFGNYDASTSNQFIPGGIFWNSDGAPGGMGDMHFVNNSSTGLARLQFSRMVIKKDGKIGIGTSTPTELLHLQSADSDLDIETNDGAESSSIHFKKSRGTVAAPTILSSVDYFANIQFMGYDGSTYHTGGRIEGSVDGTPAADNMPGKIVLYTRPAGVGAAEIERMRIDNQGEVGIGISSNMSGKLHVSSSVATWTTSNSAVYGDVYGSIQSSRGVAGVSNATGLYGIGVYGYSQGAATNNYGVYGFATGGTNNYAGYFASGDVYIQNNLGIGVSVPDGKLHVAETKAVYDGTDGAYVFIQNTDATANSGQLAGIKFRTDGVGAGTNARYKGGIAFEKTGSWGVGDLLFLTNSVSSNASVSAADERMRITSSGYVGIGTATPTALLSVNGAANKPGGGSWTVYSDARSKENVIDYNKGLTELLQLRPVSFNYKSEFKWGDKTYVGLIAQEVELVVPTMVEQKEVNGISDFREVDPNEINYMLVNAIKEQQKMIDDLKKEVEALKNK